MDSMNVSDFHPEDTNEDVMPDIFDSSEEGFNPKNEILNQTEVIRGFRLKLTSDAARRMSERPEGTDAPPSAAKREDMTVDTPAPAVLKLPPPVLPDIDLGATPSFSPMTDSELTQRLVHLGVEAHWSISEDEEEGTTMEDRQLIEHLVHIVWNLQKKRPVDVKIECSHKRKIDALENRVRALEASIPDRIAEAISALQPPSEADNVPFAEYVKLVEQVEGLSANLVKQSEINSSRRAEDNQILEAARRILERPEGTSKSEEDEKLQLQIKELEERNKLLLKEAKGKGPAAVQSPIASGKGVKTWVARPKNKDI